MHIVLYVLAAVAAAFLIFLLTAVITDYRPAEREVLQDLSGLSDTGASDISGDGSAEILPDSLTILCWNIGYGGLGDDMDFFYDGGTQVRTSRERTQANIDGIIAEIRRHSPDIILLQEVDECSRRTYRINEVEMLRGAFPDYHIFLGYNYKSFLVPIPLKAPMGRVASGVVLMSRIAPEEVVRWQYPSRFPWPVSMFNLKRCLLTATFRLADGSSIVIGNTHNTAYDTGGMRTAETRWLGGLTARFASEGTHFIMAATGTSFRPTTPPRRPRPTTRILPPSLSTLPSSRAPAASPGTPRPGPCATSTSLTALNPSSLSPIIFTSPLTSGQTASVPLT